MLEIIPLPALGQHLNYIWLLKNDRAIAIVDPGEAAPVMRYIKAHDVIPIAILITHHHWDHVGGIAELVNQYPIPVYTPKTESVEPSTHPVGGGDVVALPTLDLELQVLDVPGHTEGAIAYYANDRCAPPEVTIEAGILFSGDTLFTAGCGRLFEGTPAQMVASLAKLKLLSPTTRLYCGHEYTLANLEFARQVEPHNQELAKRYADARRLRANNLPTVPSDMGLERATNPFLRCEKNDVIQATKDYASKNKLHIPATPTAVFAMLRHWKDQF